MKKEIIKIVALIAEVSPKSLGDNTNFTKDLDFDSLDLVTLISEVEEKYDLEIPDKIIKKIQTINDLVEYIEKNV